MTVSLRHSHEFKDYNLEKLYGVLKTYELEIQQDEEIEKSQRKEKSVALVAKSKEEETSEGEVAEAPSKIAGENKQDAGKGKSKDESEEESVHQENLDDIDEYLAFMSRRFSKLKFKRNPTMSKSIPSYRRDIQHRTSPLLTGLSLNVTTVGLLGISPMSAGNQRLRKEEMLVMALTTRKNTMTFSDLRRKLLCLRKKTGLQLGKILMKRSSSIWL